MFSWATPKNERFRTYLPDQRGHGKTDNPQGVFHFPLLVGDMLKFVDALSLAQVHGVGYSMGAGVLLGMAVQRPTLFKSLLVIGGNWRPPTQAQFTQLAGPLEKRKGLALEVMHPERGMHIGWDYPLTALSTIQCPATLVAGDRDPVSPIEDAVAMYNTLPNGRLFIVPNSAHFDYHDNPLVKQFLDGWYTTI